MDELTARFAQLVTRPDSSIPLAEAALLVAAHAHPHLDPGSWLDRLDSLAAGLPRGDADALTSHLFAELGYAGNTSDYGDPRNSYLDDVIERRLGIPITLSVLMLEVGRRAGVNLVGVGMPGHFLVRLAGPGALAPAPFFDPFDGGRCLDLEGCRERFTVVHGADARFEPRFLEPVGPRAILTRVLANLERAFAEREPGSGRWAARLHLLVPGLSVPERGRLARYLGSLGAFDEAAAELDALAPALPAEDGRRIEAEARALRARAN